MARWAVIWLGAAGAERTTGAGATGLATRTVSIGLAVFMRSIGFFEGGVGAKKRQAPKPTAASKSRPRRVLRMGVFGFVRQMTPEFLDFSVERPDLVAELLVVARFLRENELRSHNG